MKKGLTNVIRKYYELLIYPINPATAVIELVRLSLSKVARAKKGRI
jgi:hypothetical protein